MVDQVFGEGGSFVVEQDTLRRLWLALKAAVVRLKPQVELSCRFKAGIPDGWKVVQGTAQDIPARNRAEAVLAEREARRKLLLVDDEELLRDLWRSLVEHLGYDVVTAADGREAVAIYQRRADEFDGVILDLSMPNMNGFAAFNEIRRHRPNARVILSSGYTEQEATQQFIGRGLSAFLPKPFDLQSLGRTLSDVLECR